MSPAATATVKKTTRARKTAVSSESIFVTKPVSALTKNLKAYEGIFADLIRSINESREEFMSLQKEIDEARESWNKEQRDHEIAIAERDQQEEIARKRETETYNYETALARKKVEDEFLEKKAKWEKELAERKDEIAKEKEELEFLRKQVDGFETEKEKAVKEASLKLQKELTDRFATEKKLREQEVKSEQELLAFKITNLTSENERQADEIALLKKSLEQATTQLKDVAVKVIESSSSQVKSSVATES
jgi:colicin import membrane protein